ncbi:MAG: isochorismatase family protein, partial [Acidobacteriota bacterium]|nr:isochorismatase family protein [Acidobacteriota bacterium]
MIRRFGSETALVLIDVQRGVDELTHWGGQSGRRNNPGVEGRIALLLTAWREHGLTVLFTRHDSREAASPLRSDHVGYGFKAGLEPLAGETVFGKRVNSGYVGTKLEVALRDSGIRRVVHVGFFTNMCV